MNNDLQNLMKLIGTEIDTQEVVTCMTEKDEYAYCEEVEGYTTHFDEWGTCQLYTAYYENDERGEEFRIWVDDENIIREIN